MGVFDVTRLRARRVRVCAITFVTIPYTPFVVHFVRFRFWKSSSSHDISFFSDFKTAHGRRFGFRADREIG